MQFHVQELERQLLQRNRRIARKMLRCQIEERERAQRSSLPRPPSDSSGNHRRCDEVMHRRIEIERHIRIGPRRHLQIEDDRAPLAPNPRFSTRAGSVSSLTASLSVIA